jgi:hypothetical protein
MVSQLTVHVHSAMLIYGGQQIRDLVQGRADCGPWRCVARRCSLRITVGPWVDITWLG